MYSFNAVQTFGAPLKEGLQARRIGVSLGNLPIEDMNRLGWTVAHRIERDYGGVVAFSREDGTGYVYYLGSGHPKDGTIETPSRGVVFKAPVKDLGMVTVGPDKPWLLNTLLRESLTARIKASDFKRSYMNKFYGGTPKFFAVGEFQEPVYVYDGFEIEPRVQPDGSALVFLNPSATWRINLYEYVRLLRARGISDKDIEQYVINGRPKRQASVEPYGKSCLIISMDSGTSVDDFKLDEETIRNRWLRTHRTRLPQDDFIVHVDDEKTPLAYPASQVFLATRGLPFTDQQRKVFMLPPKKKAQKTLEFLKRLLGDPLQLGTTKIAFDTSSLVSIESLEKEGKVLGTGRLEAPTLRFQGNGVGKEPKDVRHHGPYSGPKDLNVLYVVPEAFEHIVEPFSSALSRSYGELRLGSMQKLGVHIIKGKPVGTAYRQAAPAVSIALAKLEGPKIAIIVLPYKGEQKFDFIKGSGTVQGAEKYFQFVLKDTMERVVKGDRFLTHNVATQMYFKALVPGANEAVWILSRPAGGVGNTIYSAYDVSREVTREYDVKTKRVLVERTEAAARAAICDCFGLTVRLRSKVSPVGEALSRETIKDILLGLEKDAKKSLNLFGQDLKRIVMFKDGEMRINERRIIEQAVEEVRDFMGRFSFEGYSVVKGSIERIYGPNNGNPPPGFYVLLPDSQALLVSSDLSIQKDRVSGEDRLLANPLLIRRETVIPENGVDLKTLLQEFFDLTRLHWQSLYFHTKTCLPLKLVQEIGQYSRREILFPQDIPYPPL